MSKKKDIKFLDVAAKRLSRMKLKRRQQCLVTLMAWHVISCPQKRRADTLESMCRQALELFDLDEVRRADNASSDLRH